MNEKEFEFLGIKEWHEKGVLGQEITVASIENGLTLHSRKVIDILKQILPKATILTSIKYWRDVPQLDGYTSSQSRSGSDEPQKIIKQQELYEKNVFMTCAIGNEGRVECNPLAKYPEWVSVGACSLVDGKIIPEYYSSESTDLDFVALTNLKTSLGKFNGSSCATPVLQGMAMLVKCYFKMLGKNLTNKQLYEFMIRYSIDVGDKGKDNKTGYGLFILPKLEDIMNIELKIGQKTALIDGRQVELDVPPKIENGRTLVPLRFIAENLGYEVEWDQLTQTIYISR